MRIKHIGEVTLEALLSWYVLTTRYHYRVAEAAYRSYRVYTGVIEQYRHLCKYCIIAY